MRALLPAVKYQALAAGEVDVIDGYSTDGLIARYDLVVLDGRQRLLSALRGGGALAGRRLADSAAGGGGRADGAERTARRGDDAATQPAGRGGGRAGRARSRRARWESSGWSVGRQAVANGGRESPGERLLHYLWAERATIASLTGRHVLLVLASLAAGIAIAVPLGLALERRRRIAEGVIRAVGLLQTIPGIALLAFMIPLLGIGVVPALVALFLYSLYPILRNTYIGVRDAAPDAVGAATALGMTPAQVLRHVRLPLAAPRDHGGDPDRRGHQRRDGDARGFHRGGRPGGSDRRRARAVGHEDDPLRRASGRRAGAGGGLGVGEGGAEGGSAVLTSVRRSR